MLKRLFGNKGVVTIIAFIVCIVIILFAYKYRVDKEIQAVSVPYAKKKIDARTEITEDLVGTVKVASSMITSSVIKNKENVIGKYVNYNTFIPAGSLFYQENVVTWDHMPDSAWKDVPDGETIVSLPVNIDTTRGNTIFPGDTIDLYYEDNYQGKYLNALLIKGIKVLAVKDQNGNHIFKRSAEQQNASALIFSVNEELHLLFRQAQATGGTIIPVQRDKNYNAEDVQVSEYVRSIIKSQVMDLEPDAVTTNTTTNN